jgi:hypothetical protein
MSSEMLSVFVRIVEYGSGVESGACNVKHAYQLLNAIVCSAPAHRAGAADFQTVLVGRRI